MMEMAMPAMAAMATDKSMNFRTELSHASVNRAVLGNAKQAINSGPMANRKASARCANSTFTMATRQKMAMHRHMISPDITAVMAGMIEALSAQAKMEIGRASC